MNSFYIYIAYSVFVFIFLVPITYQYIRNNLYFSDYQTALLVKFFYIIIIISIVIVSLLDIETDFFKLLCIPLLLLIFFDFIFVSIVLQIIKFFIYNIEFYIERISQETLFRSLNFNASNAERLNSIVSPFLQKFNVKERYVISIPQGHDSINESLLQKNFIAIVNYFWLFRLYQKNKLDIFLYILSISLGLSIFYLLTYDIYYKLYWKVEIKNNTYFIFFSIIWLVYSIIRVKTLVGINFFDTFYDNYENEINTMPVLKYLTIYRINSIEQDRLDSAMLTRFNIYKTEIKTVRENVEKITEYFIVFISTVLLMIIIGLF